MKRMLTLALCALLLLAWTAPALADGASENGADAVTVTLDGERVLADGQPVPEEDTGAAVYTAHDIVYYESGHDFTYGEGTLSEEHDPAEAAAHTVVHIARPGVYRLQGTLDLGQIAVDLGKDAKDDPDAVVTLILDGLNITCTVAPAVIFYNVYECDPDADAGSAPDLTDAGARVVIADGSENRVTGSHVARIYKSVTLNDAGTAVVDSKKLHKYDGAFYSKMSMRIDGEEQGTGLLHILADNEGLDTEMHLTVNGGQIDILSGNDGVNCNEDDVSVITVNGGSLSVTVTGATGEGDGIDSNGWLVINGGAVTVQACSSSGDSGLDSACGVLLNGGTVAACGNMLDPLTPAEALCCAVFTFPQRQTGGSARYALTDGDGRELAAFSPENDFTYLVLCSADLPAGESVCLTADGAVLPVTAGGGMGGPAMGHGPQMPGADAPEPPEGGQAQPPQAPADAPEPPDGSQPQGPEMSAGERFPAPDQAQPAGDAADSFTLSPGLNTFTVSG